MQSEVDRIKEAIKKMGAGKATRVSPLAMLAVECFERGAADMLMQGAPKEKTEAPDIEAIKREAAGDRSRLIAFGRAIGVNSGPDWLEKIETKFSDMHKLANQINSDSGGDSRRPAFDTVMQYASSMQEWADTLSRVERATAMLDQVADPELPMDLQIQGLIQSVEEARRRSGV